MKRTKKLGFTIIELLVVIAIFGLLVSIILVAVRGAKERAGIAKLLQYSATIHHALGADVVGEWKFEEGSGSSTTNDTSGNGNNATLKNGVSWIEDDLVAQLGKWAVTFDTVNDYIETNASSSSLDLGGGDVTITAWVKRNDSLLGDKYIYWYSGSSNYSLYLENTGKIRMEIKDVKLSSNNTLVVGDKWYFVAGTWNNNTKKMALYIDGEKDKEEDRTPSNWTPGADGKAYIGYQLGATIDDLRVYKEAMSTAQIRKNYVEGAIKRGLLAQE